MGALYTVRIGPTEFEFKSDGATSLLQAAMEAGFSLPYGCRNGACGACKAHVVEGEVDLVCDATYSLTSYERDLGFTLLCNAFALSDLVIEIIE